MDNILCDDVIKGLKLLSDPTQCDDENFKAILEKANSTLKTYGPQKIKGVGGSKKHEEMMLALLILLTETCRKGLDIDQLDSLLKENNFPSKRTEMVKKLFESVKSCVTLELDATGTHLPHVIGCNWSLDYCVKDSSNEHVNSLEYLVDLQTQGVGGAEETVQFACSVDEMQDFVSQLKEAVKHIEKMATG